LLRRGLLGEINGQCHDPMLLRYCSLPVKHN